MPLFGIEVSKYNGNVDHIAAKKAGVRFAVISASVGMRADTRFSQNAEAFFKAGVPIGACHYITATSVHEAVSEARFFADIILPYKNKFTLPPVCCIDINANIGTSHIARIFAKCVTDFGFDVCGISDSTDTLLADEKMIRTHTRHGQLVGVIGEFACAFAYSPVSRRIIKSRTDITDDILDYIERYERGEYVLARLADMTVARSINPLKNPSYERIVPLIRLCCRLSLEDIAHICAHPNRKEVIHELYRAMIR